MWMNVNGVRRELRVEPGDRLVDVLRDRLGLLGTKMGCGEGECGACTVIMNGRAVLSCLTLAVQAGGAEILTIEGLGSGTEEPSRDGDAPDRPAALTPSLHPLQKAFVEEGAIQCGFCTPGMILAAKGLLDRESDPTEARVREALSGNLCRCTGYDKPVKAVLKAAAAMREER
jgi:carbon-monoxide dehydrogenase small subunit